MLWSLLTSFSWIYAEESCVWMDAAHVTHSHIDDIVLLKRTPVGLNNVEIKIFNPKEEEYQFLWEADIGDGVFAYNPKWAWVQSIRITNGCTSVRYKIDVGLVSPLRNIKENIVCESKYDIYNLSHSINNDTVTINWNEWLISNLKRLGFIEYAVTWDFNNAEIINIYLFNYEEDKYELIWSANVNDKIFKFESKWETKRNLRLKNWCNDIYYTADIETAKKWTTEMSQIWSVDTQVYNDSWNSQWTSDVQYPWYSLEEILAYNFAYKNWLTSINNIEKVQMDTVLTRIAMAKMLSYYAINVLWNIPDTSKIPNFNDITKSLDSQYNNWVTLAYQLGIMWVWTNKFRPYDIVTRAEFATALSRLLYKTEDWKWNIKYYEPHISKLYSEWIISNMDPKLQEKRWYIMLMLMRSVIN